MHNYTHIYVAVYVIIVHAFNDQFLLCIVMWCLQFAPIHELLYLHKSCVGSCNGAIYVCSYTVIIR